MTVVDKNRVLIRLAEGTSTHFGKVAFHSQSAAQKVFTAIWELESQVNNGGFDAYFRHSDSEVIAYAPLSLGEIGALSYGPQLNPRGRSCGQVVLPATTSGWSDNARSWNPSRR